jgi:TPR repeat protein
MFKKRIALLERTLTSKKPFNMAKGDKLYFNALKEASKNTEIGDSNALKLLQKAIDKNNSKAQYALATWYLYGKTVKKDYKVAVKLLLDSSVQNNELACFDLAVCYENGFGVKKSTKKAFLFYSKAILLGEKQSIYEVGRCYYYGIGVNKNLELASVYLDIASLYGIGTN